VHTVGPCDVDYSDKDELQIVLTKTYYNVIKYSSETLRISILALPAISGGIFHVKLESVIKALYTALKQYTDEYKKMLHTPILKSVHLVNNSHAMTTTAAYLFQELYAADHPSLPALPRYHVPLAVRLTVGDGQIKGWRRRCKSGRQILYVKNRRRIVI